MPWGFGLRPNATASRRVIRWFMMVLDSVGRVSRYAALGYAIIVLILFCSAPRTQSPIVKVRNVIPR